MGYGDGRKWPAATCGYVDNRRWRRRRLTGARFALIAERYERRSRGVTSNLVFSEWERIFANPWPSTGWSTVMPSNPCCRQLPVTLTPLLQGAIPGQLSPSGHLRSVYRAGIRGFFHRSAVISSGSSTPEAARSWAMPTRPRIVNCRQPDHGDGLKQPCLQPWL